MAVDPFEESLTVRRARLVREGRNKCAKQMADRLKDLGCPSRELSRLVRWIFRDGTAKAKLVTPPDTKEDVKELLKRCDIEVGLWRQGQLGEPEWRWTPPNSRVVGTVPGAVGESPREVVKGVSVVEEEVEEASQPSVSPVSGGRRRALPVVDASCFERDRAPAMEEMEYVAANLGVADPDPREAPSRAAWSQLAFVRTDQASEKAFWAAYWKETHRKAGDEEDDSESAEMRELLDRLAELHEDALADAVDRQAGGAA